MQLSGGSEQDRGAIAQLLRRRRADRLASVDQQLWGCRAGARRFVAITERFDPPGFKLRLGLKDANLVLAAANAAAVPMPAASLVHDRMLGGVARGAGELDWSAITRLIAEDAGIKPRP